MSGPPVTVTIRVDVHDPAGFRRYAEGVLALVERHGGELLAAGPATAVEGAPSTAATWAFVQRWPSRAHYDAFSSDPAYQPLKAERQRSASTEILVVAHRD